MIAEDSHVIEFLFSDMANLASAHNLQALSKAALRYAHENVETVLQSQEFLKSPINQVRYFFWGEGCRKFSIIRCILILSNVNCIR